MPKMQELYEKVAADGGLQAKFAEIMKGAEQAGETATREKLISFAREAGFEVSFDEVKEYLQKLTENKGGSLSDAELDMVAGGKSSDGIFNIVKSVLTLGVICATNSAIEEVNKDGGCGAMFQ